MPHITFVNGLWWVWLSRGSPWGLPGGTKAEAWKKYENWINRV